MAALLWTLLCSAASAGSVTTHEGLQFFWNITESNLTVVLMMPQPLADVYDYWGVGFKDTASRVDMQDANLWVVTKSGQLYDSWSTDNIEPKLPGLGTAHLLFHVNQSGHFYTKITRSLQAVNSAERTFTQNATLLLLYAFGSMEQGRLLPHAGSESGGLTITLANNYVVSYAPTSSVLLGIASAVLGVLALC